MKTTKLMLIVIFTQFCINNTNAQTHTFMPGWCKLAKSSGKSVKSESAIHQCQVCDAKDKKEKAAKLTEDNRRNQMIWDKAKADKIASENARKAKLLEDAKKAHSGEVLINGNKNIGLKNVPSSKISAINKLQKNYFYSSNKFDDSKSFLNYFNLVYNSFIVNGDTVFKKHEFKSCHGIASELLNNHPEINKYNFPPNIGIVILNEEKTIPIGNGRTRAVKSPISDLVDIKGRRILNDDNITAILHLADDYFILAKGFTYSSDSGTKSDDAEIYNLKTKKSFPITKGFIYGSSSVFFSNDLRTACVAYCIKKERLKPKDSYKAFVVTSLDYSKKYAIYYINNDGEIERQEINN